MTLWPELPAGYLLSKDVRIVKDRRKKQKEKSKERMLLNNTEKSAECTIGTCATYMKTYMRREDYWRMLNKICRGIRHFD